MRTGKYRKRFKLNLSRHIFSKSYSDLSYKAKWFFTVLSELEHRFTAGKKEGEFFFRTTVNLVKDSGMAPKTIRDCRRELEDAGLIEMWKMHWRDPETEKLSEKHVIAFRLLV